MENKEAKSAGAALIMGSLLLFVTMVLHPSGGSFAHLLELSVMIIVAHSIALVSIPIILIGFWGLSKQFRQESLLSQYAFFFMAAGLFAALCAAAVNGLALPLFVRSYADAPPETIPTIVPLLKYNSALNHGFDFIFIVAVCVAIVLWSIAIIKEKEWPRWIGYYGLLLGLTGIAVLASGFTLVDLRGFRFFVFGLVSWIILAGFFLRRFAPSPSL